ncbi:hypothetical protein AXX17_AT3G38560 [Arabidopsis thaliana]|uniref:HAT C-terminal dimerisation domain-containing protein n=1 Tax=Arabidopsis thaliana TaxID=3702 RepID=A0A178VH54_ARATH|nr:hypothetical protein AXX17_AT3G38560 [Arabidopsis thaliana]
MYSTSKEGLILDVFTRWNSTYHMLSRAIKFKDVLRNLADVETSYTSFPSDLEWSRGELICEFFRNDKSDFGTLDRLTSKSIFAHVRSKIYKLFKAYKKRPSSITSSSQIETLEEDIPAGYNGFYAFVSQKAGSSGKSELDIYLGEPTLDMAAFRHFNVLAYWKDNSCRFKELSSMACDVLSIPITMVAFESSFSIGSRVLSKYRSSLLPENVQALICTRNWLRGFPKEGEEEEVEEEEVEEEKEEEKEEA